MQIDHPLRRIGQAGETESAAVWQPLRTRDHREPAGAGQAPPVDALRRMGAYDQGADVPVIVRGEGCHVWDEHGNRYFDGLSARSSA